MKRHLLATLGISFGIITIAGAGLTGALGSAINRAVSSGYPGIKASVSHSRSINFRPARSLGKAIPHMSILDAFGRQELPLATKRWSKTSWTDEIGSSWRGKWHGYGATLSHLAGAYWNRATFRDSDGPVVVAATLGTGPIYERWSNEYLSLWLNMPNPHRVRSGYEVRFSGAKHTSTAYKVDLSKWVSGRRTVLAKRRRVSLPVNTKFALSETGGSLVVWTGGNRLTPILSAADSTYSGGYAGIEANRGEGTAYNFRAGNVTEERRGKPK